jgi:SAM-dependent methyltransferase
MNKIRGHILETLQRKFEKRHALRFASSLDRQDAATLKMSCFTDYDAISKHYDKWRQPVGLAVITSAIIKADKKLGGAGGLVVLDAGCGSGNYLVPLSKVPGVAKVVGLEVSDGMRKCAEVKAQTSEHILVKQGSILAPPFEPGSFDVCVVNQVLHHCDDIGGSFPNGEVAIRGLQALLRPGGVLIINFMDPSQIEPVWYYELFKPQMEEYARLRLAPCAWFEETLDNAGFVDMTFDIVREPLFTKEEYLSLDGPESEDWRSGESAWAALSAAATEEALKTLRTMRSKGTLDPLLEAKEKLRQDIGLTTSLVAWKPSDSVHSAHFEKLKIGASLGL